MRIAIAGGGMVGLMLARLLRLRGFEPMVFERMQEGAYIPRGYMLGYQGFPPFEELGVLHQIRESGWDIAPREDGSTVAIAVNVGTVLHLLARDLPVEYEHVVVDLVRDGADRVVGVVVEGPEGRREVAADLVVACDGINSPVREMAGLEAKFDPNPGRDHPVDDVDEEHIVVRDALLQRRRSHRHARLAGGLRRLAQHRQGRPRRRARARRRGDQADVHRPAARGRGGHPGAHLDRSDPLRRAAAPVVPRNGGSPDSS